MVTGSKNFKTKASAEKNIRKFERAAEKHIKSLPPGRRASQRRKVLQIKPVKITKK